MSSELVVLFRVFFTYFHFKLCICHVINDEFKCYTNKQFSHNCKSNKALSSLEEQADYFESSSDAVNGSI